MLLKSTSQKELVETARNHQWSIDFTKRGNDTLHIIALRAEFEPDTSTLTTGNGQFGLKGDRKELRYYSADTVYKYDNIPSHDSLYFVHQLAALRNYYNKVSRGSLTLDFSLYPAGNGEAGYKVPYQMTHYSPGWKRKREKTDEYWERKTHGLMMFVTDALIAADDNRNGNSPFRNLHRDGDGILRDAATGRKAVILILHAGASYLTDGGAAGEPDSPSDMIDAFINQEYFKYYKDTLKLKNDGIPVTGYQGDTLTIDEVMMCAETSNQDGLNWGIQGVLVNQLARQLGIPDLFSTSSGISAIGAFCIMDFAGYSAGQGFIPPYPSAWVRAFMGWDKPYTAGAGGAYSVKALTSVIDREGSRQAIGDDTTILLIPLNSNEYYLVENRQRNLTGDKSAFNYDKGSGAVIESYPYNVNIGANVKQFSSSGESRVIVEAKNNDVSLPASGVLVWHIDERVIRQRLAYNIVNADSSYRGVRLVEADGVNDLGVAFTDAFYQAAAFDYGGAEDVFPHLSIRHDKSKPSADAKKGFGPYTRPSTRANDGGHTYLSIEFSSSSGSPKTERMLSFQGDTVVNYSDSSFIVDVKYDYLTPGWPRRAAPENFYDPLVTGIAVSSSSTNKDTALAVLSESGRLYLYSVNGNRQESYGNNTAPISAVDYHGKPVNTPLSVTYFDSIPGVFTFPTAIAEKLYIPSISTTPPNQHALYIYNSVDINDRTIIPLPAAPSSHVCGINNAIWALGLVDGRIVIGSGINTADTIKMNSDSPVCAVAALKDSTGGFAAMQDDGTLSIVKQNQSGATISVKIAKGIAPFALVTGDLDNDGKSELIVSDSRQGVWVYTREPVTEKLMLAQGWKEDPNDWANAYYVDPQKRSGRDDRSRYAQNASAPALADLNRDGHLDIILSGTNGIYALNRKGALLSRWPAYLDSRYWYQRGSVATAPIAVSSGKNEPMVLFSSPTGENATFSVAKVVDANRETGVVTFRKDDGTLDSLWDLPASSIDTILTLGDSLVYPYILPGGFIDALTSNAARPASKIGSWPVPQSRWPLSAGSPVTASPLVYRASPSAAPALFAVSSDGMVYRWGLYNDMRVDSLYWPQNGFDAARSFAYGGAVTKNEDIIRIKEPIIFWNYPNPTSKDVAYTTFKYQFSGPAKNVRLDIRTITGYKMDTFKNLSGDFPDWNEFSVNLKKYGPGIYRCRMEAVVGGKKYSKFWKMAVVK
jgi:M6 family metalloprotease-like protein